MCIIQKLTKRESKTAVNQQVNDHKDIWFLWSNKEKVLLNCCRVITIVYLHHLDTNETPEKGARWEVQKDV